MNGKEALAILRHPVFGDEQHIEALRVYKRIIRLNDLREEWSDEQGLEAWAEIYKQRPLPEVEDLTDEQMAAEISYWEAVEEEYL